MSDGKYLINKSSLTGIADAVRNKLGAGEATTDPQTGDIVYPEGKGYYIDSVPTMFIKVPDNNAYSVYPGSQVKTFIRCAKSDYLAKVEKPVSEIEVEGIFGSPSAAAPRFTRYIVINSNSFQLDDSNQTNIQNFKQTFDTPQTYLSISISVTNNYTREKLISWSNVKIYLRDENGNLIDLITSGFPSNGCTIGTTTSQIQKPIPYSVADIKNNIKDYWSIPDGSLEITENGTYDVTDKASAVVAVSGGGGTPAPLPVKTFTRDYRSAAFSEDLAWTGATDAQSLIDRYLINVVLADSSRPLMTKNDGSFVTVKEIRENPLPNGSSRYSITAEEAQYAYDNGYMLAMTGDNGDVKDNTYFIMVKGTVIYWGNMYGIQSQTWASVFVRREY